MSFIIKIISCDDATVIMRSGGWWYKDRLGRSRGPSELITLKTAWASGVIDTHTFIWGEDMDEWAPIGMVYGMEKAIATWEGLLILLSTFNILLTLKLLDHMYGCRYAT